MNKCHQITCLPTLEYRREKDDMVQVYMIINGINKVDKDAQVRTYATKYFPYRNLFNTSYMVCFVYGLLIYELKGICYLAQFFIISYGKEVLSI